MFSPKFYILLFIGLMLAAPVTKAQSAKSIILNGNTAIYTDAKPGDPLYKAVSALQRDLKKILGKNSIIKPLSTIKESGIVVINSNENKLVKTVSGYEAHHVYIRSIKNKPQIILEGADMRGTIYAIYTFSEKALGVPPFWYYSGWTPDAKNAIKVSSALNINCRSPQVKYRAWFPNDTDLFAPWRKSSEDNNEMWLEAALRLKLNAIEFFDAERDYGKKYSVSPTTQLISDYGLINTTHHHSPLNASFAGWKDYWRKTRDTIPPELSLANEKKLEEFWRYNVECIVKNNIDMLWVIGFRGNGDHPFWFTFKDAPTSMKERGAIISKMMEKQHEIVLSVTHDTNTKFRTIFYDELSDLLAQGYIYPPADSAFIWTYVAARRDHYPNNDLQELKDNSNRRLGYYFNYQFTSTGSHLAAAEGPWKMEKNFLYVAQKSNKPVAYSVVNAGNIREYVMELSANAAMMQNFKTYKTDSFLKDFCAMYYGSTNADKIANLYKAYYNAYWQQKKPDFPGFDRQYIFQDLRYKRAIQDISSNFKSGNLNPLKDVGAEQLKGRTFRIVPADNQAKNEVEAIINGTTQSAAKFLKVANDTDAFYKNLNGSHQTFFNDNLRAPARYMYYLNLCLLQLCKAYKSTDKAAKNELVKQAVADLKNAEKILFSTEHGAFSNWYAGDKVFGFEGLYKTLNELDQAK